MNSNLIDNYLGYNPERNYLYGDRLIRLSPCKDRINLYRCIVRQATFGKFIRSEWKILTSEDTGFNNCSGYRAYYLGNCSSKVIIEDLPKIRFKLDIVESELYFDNVTFI